LDERGTPGSRRPGRPRSAEATAAILQAAAELLAEQGLLAMTVDAVAARAGASKATIYRWWGSKEALALDAFATGFEDRSMHVIDDTGSLVGDLRAILGARVHALAAPGVLRLYSALLAHARADPAFAATYRARVYGPLQEGGHGLFVRAIARGEIGADTDVDAALDLLLGALTYRLFQGHAPVEPAFIDTIIAIVVNGLRLD
jgi:AcrR family transcriptional regulator